MVTITEAIKAKDRLVLLVGKPWPDWLTSIGVSLPEKETEDCWVTIGVTHMNYHAELLATTDCGGVMVRIRIDGGRAEFL